ncbi:hypothetical protein, partial [Klebsiella pneumoniae]|uniref:hypothetical protein n=1 Tax=Klebsiella pneumoniae TaxID=573 RepID=UPI002555BED9
MLRHIKQMVNSKMTFQLHPFESIFLTFVFNSAMLLREGANKQVISSQADSLIKISRIWADFFPANTSNQPI